MKSRFRVVTLASAIVLVGWAAHWGHNDSSAVHAQQRAQTDLAFVRERARIDAAQRRITSLTERLANIAPADSSAPARRAAAGAVRSAPATPAEARVSERLRHRDRAISASAAQALRERLAAAAETARSLGERVNQPSFGAGLRALEQELERLGVEIAGFESP